MVEKKKDEPGPQFRVQTDGINFEGAFINDDLVDVNAVTCNDVSAVLQTFGVEAARRTVVAEVGAVFSAYGIGVDSRHLSLISDHMTRQVMLTSMCHLDCAMFLPVHTHFLASGSLQDEKAGEQGVPHAIGVS